MALREAWPMSDTAGRMGDLSVTALYTSAVWAWAKLPCADLLASADAQRVFGVTNAALALRRGTPLRYALLHRHAMIDHIVRDAKPAHVLELAAGLSCRGAALTADPQLHYIEVDLPHVIAHKRRLLSRSDEGRAVLARPTFSLVAGDVTAIPLEPLIADRTLVIAEGLVMYLDGPARRALFDKLAPLADQLVFDLTPASEEPAAGWSGRVLEAAMKRFTGGKTFERDARTREDVVAELRAAGFAEAEAFGSADVARAWSLPHAERRTPTVVFSARAAPATRS
jgi:O-methyltransferase involved in polyketide biosynthesis